MKSTQEPPAPKKISKKLLTMGALGFSLVLHFALLLITGGVVLIQGVIPKPSFSEYAPITDDSTTPPPDAPEEIAAHDDPSAPLPPEMTDIAPAPVQAQAEPTAPAPDTAVMPNLIATASLNPMQNSIAAPPTTSSATQDPTKPLNQDKASTTAVRTMASLFGSKGEVSDALVGNFYDLKQTADRKDNDLVEDPKAEKAFWEAKAKYDADKKPSGKPPVNPEIPKNAKYDEILNDFLKNWDVSVLSKYYKAPNPLSSYQIFVPAMGANEAPKAFDVERTVKPKRWVIYYKGNFIAPKSGFFRFVGMADDVLVVRFDRKVALNGSLTGLKVDVTRETVDKSPTMGRMNLVAGPWIHMSEGQGYPIEVITGELPGGSFYTFLMIQEKGVNYPTRPNGSPTLPVFQMAPTKMPKFEPEKNGPTVAAEPFSGKA